LQIKKNRKALLSVFGYTFLATIFLTGSLIFIGFSDHSLIESDLLTTQED
jgi:hypothetical protein